MAYLQYKLRHAVSDSHSVCKKIRMNSFGFCAEAILYSKIPTGCIAQRSTKMFQQQIASRYISVRSRYLKSHVGQAMWEDKRAHDAGGVATYVLPIPLLDAGSPFKIEAGYHWVGKLQMYRMLANICPCTWAGLHCRYQVLDSSCSLGRAPASRY